MDDRFVRLVACSGDTCCFTCHILSPVFPIFFFIILSCICSGPYTYTYMRMGAQEGASHDVYVCGNAESLSHRRHHRCRLLFWNKSTATPRTLAHTVSWISIRWIHYGYPTTHCASCIPPVSTTRPLVAHIYLPWGQTSFCFVPLDAVLCGKRSGFVSHCYFWDRLSISKRSEIKGQKCLLWSTVDKTSLLPRVVFLACRWKIHESSRLEVSMGSFCCEALA